MLQFTKKKTSERIKIEGDINEYKRLYESLTIPNANARFSDYAPDTVCPISLAGTFLIGMLIDICSKCKELKIDYKIDESITPIIKPKISVISDTLIQPECDYDYRDYQETGINAAIKYGRGLCVSPTASGKSLFMYGVIVNAKEYQERTLLIVPGTQLVRQMNKDFTEYGSDFHCVFSSESKTIPDDARVIISNREWLNRHAKELPSIKAIIVDEVHKLQKNSSLYKTIRLIKSNYLLGFTGTMPASTEKQWFIKSVIGPIIFEEHTYNLQAQNYLAQIRIISVELRHKKLEVFPRETYEDIKKAFYYEYKHLEQDKKSNLTCIKLIESFAKTGNTLVIFDHTGHGEFMQKNTTGNVMFINGSVNMDVREDIRTRMGQENDVILYANEKCFGTGTNVPNIKNVIIISHGKGLTKIIQMIGRGLRKTSSSVETMNLVDIHHNYKYSSNHFQERLLLYRKFYKKSYDKSKTIHI
jgi:superfamily II DNA or RNA helicase